VFNLVGKRYLFLIISLIIIIPGTLSLIFKGLDVGIDFAGGSTLQFRPSQHVASPDPVKALLIQLGLKDVQVNIGSDTNTPANHGAWVQLNTQINSSDTAFQNAVTSKLNDKYGSGNVLPTYSTLQVTNGGKTQTVTLITLSSGAASSKIALTESDLTTLFKDLPKAIPVTSSSSTTGTPTATATATVVPTATPTATATANATVTATPAATATTTTTAGTVPVNVTRVAVGTTTDMINILTSTTVKNDGTTQSVTQIQSAFLQKFNGYLTSVNNSSVSGSVASDTIRNSILAVFAASALILLYVWWAFRKVQKSWRYGASAILALLHDVLVVLGVFSILGWTLHIQVDALFITALLTVVGFSVHDTIVVFDRIRENMQRRSSESFEQVVNASLVQTLSRSLNTSLTVLFTLSALTLFGGDTIRTFTFALLIGIFSGTYSSIFNASMILVIWEKGELGLWRFNRDNRGRDGRIIRPSQDRELVKSR
jgi:preprotein translocase SecF subunit